MRILYDSKSLDYKTPFGCLKQGEVCSIRIDIPEHCRTRTIFLCIENDDKTYATRIPLSLCNRRDGYERYEGTFSLEKCDLYFYHFEIETEESSFTLWKEGRKDTNINTGESWQLTCYQKDFEISPDFQGKVMYQIFPDRFYQSGDCDLTEKLTPFWVHQDKAESPCFLPDEKGIIQNNDFFGGNLRGIMEKLPYLKKLRVEILYLNPIFMAYSNHRYDTADYKRIDPMLGTQEDFSLLCQKAHSLGIKVILDGVFSHTGCNSVYFDKYDKFQHGACHHPDSPYRSWYQFDEREPEGYRSWWGINTLPCTEELDPAFLEFIVTGEDSVVRHWMRLGADGFRLDVADELPDEFIRLLHQTVREEKENSLVIGEVWEDASNKISYGVRRSYFRERELDSVMNYPFKNSIIDFINGRQPASELAQTVMTIAENYPKPVLDCLMNSLSTHDTMRILTVLGEGDFSLPKEQKAVYRLPREQRDSAKEKLKCAAFLQYILPGSPCIYYGDEAGMEGFEDPFNRGYFPWEAVDENLYSYFQKLGTLKAGTQALRIGSVRVEELTEKVICIERRFENELLIALCNTGEAYDCFTTLQPLFLQNAEVFGGRVRVNPFGAVLLLGKAEEEQKQKE